MRREIFGTVSISIVLLLVLHCPCEASAVRPFSAPSAGESVILLHGLGRTHRSMARLEKVLANKGYRVVNAPYPSTENTIEFLSDHFLSSVVRDCLVSNPSVIHFVTHSMGGIILRYYLKHNALDILGRVVMLSPPNKGSELVDGLKDTFIFKQLGGPAGRQLGTKKDSLPNTLGPVNFELGVIAGNKSLNFLYSLLIPGADDGIVAVERTKVEGMKDFIVLPYSHTFIMSGRDTIEQVLYFLANGVFRKTERILFPAGRR